MSKNKVRVKIIWQEKKLLHLPVNHYYITVAKFNSDWIKEAWSIKIEFDTPPTKQGNPSYGYASFLVPNAPQDKLHSGIVFELYEGKTLSAKVIVI